MQHRRLGRSGLKVSSLCLGAMTFGESKGFMKGVTSPDDEARRVLDASLAAGIDFIDTADVYSEGRSEELLGQWLEGRRNQVILATKCRFRTGEGANDQGLSRRHIVAACEASLRRLRTDWIDLYQTHLQDPDVPIDETLRALDDLVRAGKIRYAGCSNYSGARLVESLWAADRHNTVRYEAVQLQWSLVMRDAEREVIPACVDHEVGITVWSPLGRGFLSGKFRRGEPPPEGTRLESWKDSMRLLDNDRCWSTIDVVRAIGTERSVQPATVALAWLLAKPEVSSVVIGDRDEKQLAGNLAAADFTLTPEELTRLDEVSKIELGYPYGFIRSFTKRNAP